MKTISVVIPCYNESSPLNDTYREVKRVLDEIQATKCYQYEMLFINDGSKDDTIDIIKSFTRFDDTVKYVSFSRNFGKEAGMLAGLEHAKGDAVVIIDADLQHPPTLIKDMVTYYEQGYDQVIARRNRKGEKFGRKWITKTYYKIINCIMDVELVDGIGDFRLLSRKAVQSILDMPEYNRFSKGIFSWIGFEKKVINYDNNERISGESKWGFKSLLNYAVEGAISFNSTPLRAIIYIGIIITLLNVIYIGYTFINIMLFGVDMPGYFTLISAVLLLGGVQLISIGIIGEYVGRIFYEVKRRPKYIVNETNAGMKSNLVTEIKESEEKNESNMYICS